jgi:RNA polymerase sigma factor (sigma-70 family)
MFTDRRRCSTGETAGTTSRDALVASLFARHAQDVLRLVSGRARAPYTVIEDACQTAWMRLLVHSEVDVEGHGAVRWVVVTATREAWRRSAQRETPTGSWAGGGELVDGEFPEPAGHTADPVEVAIEHEHTRELQDQLNTLTGRERRFLALQALGLSYQQIAAETGASLRTVERQILRGRHKLNSTPQSNDT